MFVQTTLTGIYVRTNKNMRLVSCPFSHRPVSVLGNHEVSTDGHVRESYKGARGAVYFFFYVCTDRNHTGHTYNTSETYIENE